MLEVKGKIVSILPEQSGQGKNGTWRKGQYVLETGDQYSKKVCIHVWGDKIDEFSLKEGEEVTVSIDIESREFNGRWYTDVKAWKVAKANSLESSIENNSQEIPDENWEMPDEGDVLPF